MIKISKYSVITLLFLSLGLFISKQTIKADAASNQQDVVELINVYRNQNGLAPLKINNELKNCAVWHATDMAQYNYFNHNDRFGRSPVTRCNGAFGYSSTSIGENIAAGYSTPAAVVQAWKESTDHNTNMLTPSYREIGLGYASGHPVYNHMWSSPFGVDGNIYPVVINLENDITESLNVSLYVYGSGFATQMRFSNDNTNWSSWESYSSSKSWTLTTGNGLKTVYAQIRNGSNVVKNASDQITLQLPRPVVNISSNQQQFFNSSSGTVNFTDLSTNVPTSWLWDFGDGVTSTQQNPNHNYTAPGSYTVTLSATNDGGTTTRAFTDYIVVSEWSNWTKGGSSIHSVGTASVSGRTFQGTIANDGFLRTKIINFDGSTFADWNKSGSSVLPVSMTAINGKVAQATVGSDGYVRIRILNADGSTSVDWIKSGNAVKQVGLTGIGNKLFVATVASDGFVRTRILNDDGSIFADWLKSGSSIVPVTLAGTDTNVLMTTVGADKFVRVRIFDASGNVTTDWVRSGNSELQVGVSSDNSKFVIATVAADQFIRTRFINEDGSIYQDWVKSGKSALPVSLTRGNSYFFLSSVGTDQFIRVRILSSSGTIYKDWFRNGKSIVQTTMAVANQTSNYKVFENTIGSDNALRYRIYNM